MSEIKQAIEEAKKKLAPEMEGLSGLTILYLDDENLLLDVINEVALEYGFKAITTTSHDVALQSLAEQKNSIVMIVSDLRMPTMDGYAFRQKTLEIAPEIPFVILSAYVDADIAVKGIENKICGFLSKPIDEVQFAGLLIKEVIPRIRSIKDDREMRLGFVNESESLIEDAEELMMTIEQEPENSDALNRYFGIMHTLKGASAFFDPKDLHHFVHKYEDILKQLQNKTLQQNEAVSAVLFAGLDQIKKLHGEFRSGVFPNRNIEDLIKILDISAAATAIAKNESAADPIGVPAKDGAPEKAKTTGSKAREDVRVSAPLLDEFMHLSGEVTVIRNMLNRVFKSIESRHTQDRDVVLLGELLEELHTINGGVQGKITEIRKVPIKAILKSLPRAIRDLSKALDKKIDLEMSGDDLRIDTSLAEVLNNSLLHIVKNSLDHGIEKNEDRVKSGKPEKGKIQILCQEKNEEIIIEIKDDGRGINTEKIKEKLIKNGSHTLEQIERMSNQELYAMIFEAGFSTAAAVTDISGRGVGMSMVKDSVMAVGGQIQIESNWGQGSVFRLILPVPKSVLIANCLSVMINGFQLGFLQDDIVRVFQFDQTKAKEYIREAEHSRSLLIENELIPLVHLRDLLFTDLENEQKISTKSKDEDEKTFVVVLHDPQDKHKLAIQVDLVMDVEDTVIKTIPTMLNRSEMYRGVTFLDEGKLGIIMSSEGVFKFVKNKYQGSSVEASAEKQKDSTEAQLAKSQAFWTLVFHLSEKGTYAIEQKNVLRLEEIPLAEVKHSGSKKVIPYREGILEIIELNSVFGKPSEISQLANTSGLLSVIVVEYQKRSVGLVVSEILDMYQVESLNVDLPQMDHGIKGHFFYNDHTVSMFDLEAAIDTVFGNLNPSPGVAKQAA